MHLATANQILAGDWPYRDFFELYGPLMYGLSALSRLMFGHRLLSEAVVVGIALAVSTYLVFKLVRSLTGSSAAAVLSALLLMVAGVRGYSYPKVVLYAVAATMWWAYVKEPTRLKALALGAWVAAAFYWRADHGVYIAAGVALAMVMRSRRKPAGNDQACAGSRGVDACGLADSDSRVCRQLDFCPTSRDGVAIVNTQHTETSSHTWPKWPIRASERCDSSGRARRVCAGRRPAMDGGQFGRRTFRGAGEVWADAGFR